MISGFSKDPLVNLVNSLSPSEKRYFKMFSAHHVKRKKTNYVKLFEHIERADKKEFQSDRLPQLRKELYEVILKSLSAFHYKSGTENILRTSLEHIEIFIKKGLINDAKKIVNKAKAIAEANENFTYLITLAQKELAIKAMELEKNGNLNELYDYVFKNIQKLKNNIQYQLLQVTFRNLMIERESGSLKKLEKEVMKNPLMQDEERALTTFSKTTYLNLHSIYNRVIGNHKKAHYYGKQLVDFFESSPDLIKKSSFNYASFLLNATGYEIDLGIYENVFINIAKLRKLVFNSDKERGHIYGSILTMELAAYINTGKMEEGLAQLPFQEKQLNANKRYLIEETFILVYYGWAAIYFYTNQYKKAIKILNKLIYSDEFKLFRVDLQVEARILKLFVYLESNNIEMLEYFLKETETYIKSSGYLSKENEIIFEFINYYLKNNLSGKIDKKKIIELKEKIEEAGVNKKEHANFDILYWIESKLTGKTYGEILRSKNYL